MQSLPFTLAAVLLLAHAESELPATNAFSLPLVAVMLGAYPALVWLVSTLLARRVRARLQLGGIGRRLARTRRSVLAVATGAFAWAVLGGDWLWCVRGAIPASVPLVTHALALLPFVCAYFAALLPLLRTEQQLEGSHPEPIRRKLQFEARGLILPVVPFLIFMGVLDLGWHFPTVRESLVTQPLLSTLALLGVLVLVLVFAPFAIRHVWPSTPLPPGELRSRLEQLAQRAGIGIREIRIWHTGRRSLINACITGAFPRLRTVFFTDGILESCDSEQLEGVFAHELGHAHHHHFFLFFFVVTAFLLGYVTATPYLPESAVLTLLILATAAYLYFWRFFGALSRHSEHQADLFAAHLIGSTPAFAQALQQIAMLTNSFHLKKSWRHPSAPTRLQRLWEHELSAESAAAFRKRSRRFLVVIALLTLSAGVGYAADRIASEQNIREEQDGVVAQYLITEVQRAQLRPAPDEAALAAMLRRAATLLERTVASAPTESERRHHAQLWLAQCYLALGEPERANAVLDAAGVQRDAADDNGAEDNAAEDNGAEDNGATP